MLLSKLRQSELSITTSVLHSIPPIQFPIGYAIYDKRIQDLKFTNVLLDIYLTKYQVANDGYFCETISINLNFTLAFPNIFDF